MQEPKSAVYTQRQSDEDEISGIGLILDEAITFKKVQNDLIKLLSSDCPDSGICAILDISQELLDKFKIKVKRKIRKINIDFGLASPDSSKSGERPFWDFAKETTGDLDLLAWPSYYSCMDHVRDEANGVIHAVDKSFSRNRMAHASGRGIFFLRHDLIHLLRLNFRRKYHNDVVRFVRERKLSVFKISCKEVDRTTLLPPVREKGQHVQLRIIRFIQVKVLEDCFTSVIEARRIANQIEKERMDKLLEITEDNVLLPPYE